MAVCSAQAVETSDQNAPTRVQLDIGSLEAQPQGIAQNQGPLVSGLEQNQDARVSSLEKHHTQQYFVMLGIAIAIQREIDLREIQPGTAKIHVSSARRNRADPRETCKTCTSFIKNTKFH